MCAGVWKSLWLGEARVLPLGRWPDCFTHARGGAGAFLGGRRAGGPARHAPAPPRPAQLRKQALTATRYTGRSRPWPRWLGIGDARRAPRPARRAGGWPAPGPARPAPLASAMPHCRRGARRPPHPAGSGPGLTCVLSNTIELCNPPLNLIHCTICEIYAEYAK